MTVIHLTDGTKDTLADGESIRKADGWVDVTIHDPNWEPAGMSVSVRSYPMTAIARIDWHAAALNPPTGKAAA